MEAVTVLAPAKLNLTLGVTGFAENGYHTLDMLMQAVSLYEKVELRKSAELRLSLPGSRVPADSRNTAVKAALAFFHETGLLAGADITVHKRVPVRAGMAGGSADAAAVLVGLNELYGARLSAAELCALGRGGRTPRTAPRLPGRIRAPSACTGGRMCRFPFWAARRV